ncbi:MAG TPA: hypothetical protein VFZ98_05525, partial [Vicinamibacterales bacterium]
PLRKAETKELGFFFTLYAGKEPKPQATLELMHNGAALATLPLTLADPDSSGRIQQVDRLPISTLVPGTYDLHVLISAGRQQIQRSAIFRIVD